MLSRPTNQLLDIALFAPRFAATGTTYAVLMRVRHAYRQVHDGDCARTFGAMYIMCAPQIR